METQEYPYRSQCGFCGEYYDVTEAYSWEGVCSYDWDRAGYSSLMYE